MKKTSMLVLLLLLALLLTGCAGQDSVARRASEVILANAEAFHAPEKLRFVSGTGDLKRDPKGFVDGLLYACLETEDEQGQKIRDNYVMCISYDDYQGYIVEREKYPNYYQATAYFERMDIPAEEVNALLDEYWGVGEE